MPSLADQMLAGGVLNIEAAHGETIEVLSGPDAGVFFTAVKEVEQDFEVELALGSDPRGKRVIRFREGFAPRIESQGQVRTDDGKKWNAVRMPGNAYLTVDFELKEIVAGKDL